MHIPFLQIYDQGKGSIRLRINFLHMEADQNTPELVQRLKNAFPFIGNEWVKTGGIGEFIAQGVNDASPFKEAAKKVARAGWRAEVHSLGRRNTPASAPADFEFEIQGFEAANAEVHGIVRDRRWVIAHVPGVTQEWIDRLQAIGGNLSLTGWQYLAGNPTASTVAPYAGPPFRMIVDSSNRPDGIHAGMSSDGMQIAPMNPWIHMYYATTGLNARGVLINGGQQVSRQEVLSLYTRQNGWFLREEDELGTIEPGKLARRPRGPQQRLLRRAERGLEEDPLGADRGRRQRRPRRRRAGPARVMEASFLLDEYRARLRALKRRRSLRDGENPYLELMTLLVAAPSGLSAALELAERRRELASLFSWAIPNARALEVLAAHAPLLECGAGMGYWSALLRARGVDVLAYDAAPPGRSSKNAYHRAAREPWTKIHRLSSVIAARRHRERTLVLCWPPYDDDAASYAVLRAYRGDTLIYIGEPDEGATGSVRFRRAGRGRRSSALAAPARHADGLPAQCGAPPPSRAGPLLRVQALHRHRRHRPLRLVLRAPARGARAASREAPRRVSAGDARRAAGRAAPRGGEQPEQNPVRS
ncbi:MAG: hypothetical protein E6H47_15895 [Betaproteobacteria bacterium]|nr:MAG: hypothetical protein E6H47_15895 [Betaproteobacteria bacterium]